MQQAGVFKPHPAVYRKAAQLLAREPGEIMMVAAHSFDVLGARACGYRGAYVNRYRLPTEESPYQPDLEVNDFLELAEHLLR
jgi:2-haloacid dehalogenase